MLTDEQVFKLLKAVDSSAVRLPPGLKQFAIAIGAEVRTKERDLVDEIVRLKLDCAGWRDKKFAGFANDDCWLYQGDGSDDLDSLVCPVVVKPQVLSGLLAKVAESERRYEAIDEQRNRDHERIAELEKIEQAVRNVFQARGRYNMQIAMCRLGELVGEQVTWPDKCGAAFYGER